MNLHLADAGGAWAVPRAERALLVSEPSTDRASHQYHFCKVSHMYCAVQDDFALPMETHDRFTVRVAAGVLMLNALSAGV